ncbi:MAG: 50S ribosomal protein L4 [Clostridia bacterium]|jgi:large subunit ribosomal protein L4|nr:50S ribosomal protein L4 [Clostridia bacterium]
MPKLALYNMEGNNIGEIEVSEKVFAQEVNKVALHQVVVNYLANQRQGTQSTKTRSEVRGGGIKPWRQKGTGRARQGSIRATQWIKGGIALGPKPRDYSYSVNKKLKKVAMISALSAKCADNEIIVVDEIKLDEIKTKKVAEMLKALNAPAKALIVTNEKNDNVVKSAKNIEGVTTTFMGSLNVYDILKHDVMVVTKDAVAKIEEVYA